MRRFGFFLLLLVYVSGCSGYRSAVVPGYIDPVSPEDSDRPEVAVGRDAKVTLHSGDVHVGEVLRIGEDSLALGRVGNYGVEETEILYQDISKVEVEVGSKPASIAVRSVGTLGIVFGGLLILVALLLSVSEWVLYPRKQPLG